MCKDNGVESEFARGNGRHSLFLLSWSLEGRRDEFKGTDALQNVTEGGRKKNPEEYEPWEKALMCAVGQKCDWTDRAYLNPILEYIGISL